MKIPLQMEEGVKYETFQPSNYTPYITVCKSGNIVTLNISNGVKNLATNSMVTAYTLPAKYRPPIQYMWTAMTGENAPKAILVIVDTDGNIKLNNYSSTAIGNNYTNWTAILTYTV